METWECLYNTFIFLTIILAGILVIGFTIKGDKDVKRPK